MLASSQHYYYHNEIIYEVGDSSQERIMKEQRIEGEKHEMSTHLITVSAFTHAARITKSNVHLQHMQMYISHKNATYMYVQC